MVVFENFEELADMLVELYDVQCKEAGDDTTILWTHLKEALAIVFDGEDCFITTALWSSHGLLLCK